MKCLLTSTATNTAWQNKTPRHLPTNFQTFKKTLNLSCLAATSTPLSMHLKYWKNLILQASMCSWIIPNTLVVPMNCCRIKAIWLFPQEQKYRGLLMLKIPKILKFLSWVGKRNQSSVKARNGLFFLNLQNLTKRISYWFPIVFCQKQTAFRTQLRLFQTCTQRFP